MAIYKLKELEEKFLILKKAAEHLPINEQLIEASAIRDAIVSDNTIGNACVADCTVAERRKRILDEIKLFIDSTIDEKNSNREYLINREGHAIVTDFSMAKKVLGELAISELEQSVLNKAENLKLLSEIKEHKKHLDTLKRVESDCKYGRYKVLLMGEFQSGKTTTLDALCDGRHIGAIGGGTATTAVPVSVSYAEQESMEIRWRSKELLLEVVFAELKLYIEDFSVDNFNIDNLEERRSLLDQIESFRSCKDIKKDDARVLSICSMVLYFYGTKSLVEKREKMKSVNDVSSITRFPEDMENRWIEKGVSDFSVDEMIFVFIEQVDCYCPAEILQDLDCSVIDCPGLFNSAYDTKVTEYAMISANAIVYLLPYHKGISQEVCKSLYELKDKYKSIHRKLFIAQNINSQGNCGFIGANKDSIKQMFDKDVVIYDGKLAYLGKIKRSYENGLLSEKDIAHFTRPLKMVQLITKTERIIEFKSFEQAWEYYIKGYKDVYGWQDLYDIDKIISDSGLSVFCEELYRFIKENEAFSVILSDGIWTMAEELMSINNTVKKLYVQPYKMGVDETSRLWGKRLERAKIFSDKIKEIVIHPIYEKDETGKSLADELSIGVYDSLFTSGFYEDMIVRICGEVYDNKKQLVKFQFSKDKFETYLKPFIEKRINELVESRFKYWLGTMKTGQDSTFNNLYIPKMKISKMEIEREWEKLYSDDKDFEMSSYLSIPKSLKDYYRDEYRSVATTDLSGMSTLLMSAGLFTALVAEIGVIVGGIIGVVVGAILAVLSAGPILWGILLGTAGVIVIAKGPKGVKDLFISKMAPLLLEELKEQDFEKSFQNLVDNAVRRTLSSFESRLALDVEKMKREQVIATSTPKDEIEKKCFSAISVMDDIKCQLDEYVKFEKEYITYEKN